REIALRLPECFGRHAGEPRDLQAVAAVGRTLRDVMQEHDARALPAFRLDRVEVDVRAAVELGRQRGQLEVMRGEKREAAIVRGESMRDRPRKRKTVERR